MQEWNWSYGNYSLKASDVEHIPNIEKLTNATRFHHFFPNIIHVFLSQTVVKERRTQIEYTEDTEVSLSVW